MDKSAGRITRELFFQHYLQELAWLNDKGVVLLTLILPESSDLWRDMKKQAVIQWTLILPYHNFLCKGFLKEHHNNNARTTQQQKVFIRQSLTGIVGDQLRSRTSFYIILLISHSLHKYLLYMQEVEPSSCLRIVILYIFAQGNLAKRFNYLYTIVDHKKLVVFVFFRYTSHKIIAVMWCESPLDMSIYTIMLSLIKDLYKWAPAEISINWTAKFYIVFMLQILKCIPVWTVVWNILFQFSSYF